MGCQKKVSLGDSVTFSICCHDPNLGVLTDADSMPLYRVYEDEAATPISGGKMAKLDDTNTVGFYSAKIACTGRNGFNVSKTYTIYIEATVDSDTGGMCYAFVVKPGAWTNIIIQGVNASDGKDIHINGKIRNR